MAKVDWERCPCEGCKNLRELHATAHAIWSGAAKPDGNAGVAMVPLPLLEALGDALGVRNG